MENVYKVLDEVIDCILKSHDYQTCILLKEKMSENEEIMSLVEKIKKTQKKYIRSGYDSKIKEELDSYYEALMCIPVYSVFSKSLERVNEMIEYVKDYLNQYFYQLLNNKKN